MSLREHSSIEREDFAGKDYLVRNALAIWLSRAPQLQIFEAIIQAIAILVVNVFLGREAAAKAYLEDQSVFRNLPFVDDNIAVAGPDRSQWTRRPRRCREVGTMLFSPIVELAQVSDVGWLGAARDSTRAFVFSQWFEDGWCFRRAVTQASLVVHVAQPSGLFGSFTSGYEAGCPGKRLPSWRIHRGIPANAATVMERAHSTRKERVTTVLNGTFSVRHTRIVCHLPKETSKWH